MRTLTGGPPAATSSSSVSKVQLPFDGRETWKPKSMAARPGARAPPGPAPPRAGPAGPGGAKVGGGGRGWGGGGEKKVGDGRGPAEGGGNRPVVVVVLVEDRPVTPMEVDV